MTGHGGNDETLRPDQGDELSLEQLRGLQHGVAATITPVSDGWRVHYFSVPDFEQQPGTTFSTFQAALAAMDEVLPVVNSSKERSRARDELRERLHRMDTKQGGEHLT